MAASQPGTSSSVQKNCNRIFLFRLQMLIVDGGLTILRNYVDQELAAQSTTLTACLANEKSAIKQLKGRKIITKIQYDLLYPSSGTVSTSDLDITLIICLMRNLKYFGLNSIVNWNIPPVQSDTSIEADICRLKLFRNKISHIATTTEIQYNDFINNWKEIEQILLRIDKIHPTKDFQKTITDFKLSIIDPNTEKRVTDEIEKWNKFDNSLKTDLEHLKKDQEAMKQIIESQTIEHTETRKRTTEIKEELKMANVKIAKIEKQLPAADNYQQHKLELRDSLITFYKTRHNQVFLSPLFEEKDTPLASFYIRPALRQVVSTSTINDDRLSIKSLSEIFKTENKHYREIYMLADAGFGKTAFSKYLANVWCQAHCPDEDLNEFMLQDDIDCMQEFEFLFLVLLRDAGNVCSIDYLIFEKIVSELGLEVKLSEDFLYKILKNEKCLVILDGLDEWTHPEKECHRSPRSIPHRNDREKCTILTTTRPWKLGVLNLNSCQIGQKVELTKLSYNSTVKLTERILQRLKSHPNKDTLQSEVTAFISGIESRQNDELASVPLLLIYTICLWCESVQIGNSKCELYINIVELLLSRTIQKHGDLQQLCDISDSDIPKCLAEYENCTKYFQLLLCLGKLAYYMLFNETRENTLVFDGLVARKYITPDEFEFALHSGMLSESTTKTLTKKFSKVSFSHKTVQEFFAAIFISSENETQKIVLETCRTVQDILDLSKIYEFISKMNAAWVCKISNDLMSVINEDEKTRDYRTTTGDQDMYDNPLYNLQEMFMSCLQEMPESENIQLCLQDFFIDSNSEHSEQLQRLLKQNKTNIKSLYIDTRRTSRSLLEIKDLFSLTDLSHIQTLVYDDDKREAEINQILFPSLQYVTLSRGIWTNNKENLSEHLAQVQNLHTLYIAFSSLSHKILETLFSFISGQKSMKELTLWGLECIEHDYHDCKGLNLDLSQHLILSKLRLMALPWRLQLNVTTPSLFDVTLWWITLDESSLLLSRDMLNIECVNLSCIEMSTQSLQNFITVLENMPQSVTVEMSHIKPETEFERVRQNIRRSQTFHVIQDYEDRPRFEFKTIKSSKV